MQIENYFSSPKNLEYKNNLAISYLNIGSLFLKQGDQNVAGALFNILQSRTIFAETWKNAQGQVIKYSYFFAYSTMQLCDLVKVNIQHHLYDIEDISQLSSEIKAMRREAYTIVQSLAEKEKLTERQLKLLKILQDETWYDF